MISSETTRPKELFTIGADGVVTANGNIHWVDIHCGYWPWSEPSFGKWQPIATWLGRGSSVGRAEVL